MSWKKTIEYTNLAAMPSKQIKSFVKGANEQGFFGVCLLKQDLRVANKYRNKDLKLITVAGFPPIHRYSDVTNNPKDFAVLLGLYTRNEISKIKDIIEENLADELDIIFPFYWYFYKNKKRAKWFITGVKKRFKKPVKVIIELGTLIKSEEQIKEVCEFLEGTGVDYVKSNSGLIKRPIFNLIKHFEILKKHSKLPLKASGGIRTVEEVEGLIKMGASRIGTSGVSDG